jgi:Zinc knuckle
MLENAISRELRDMLLHTPTPSRQYYAYAAHLQTLENRLQTHVSREGWLPPSLSGNRGNNPAPNLRRNQTAPTTASTPTQVSLTVPLQQRPQNAVETRVSPPTAATPTLPTSDPMDLSRVGRLPGPRKSAKELGLCFRCLQPGHLVKDCPLPDTRPESRRLQVVTPSPARPLSAASSASLSTTLSSPTYPGGGDEPGISRLQAQPPRTARISAASVHGLPVQEEYERSNMMILPANLESRDKTCLTYALVDSGAEGKAFIDESWAASQNLVSKPRRHPCVLKVFDGADSASDAVNKTVSRHHNRWLGLLSMKYSILRTSPWPEAGSNDIDLA